MENYSKVNNILGWLTFVIATAVYFLTLEPTASWWDCGEYIATAYKLQVGHPPGAPLFQLLGRFFSLFAFGDASNVAMMVNAMSALSSSFTILFLFWTITMLGKKIVLLNGEMTEGKMYAVFGSGLVGALAFTFSDSFWFSAVEGEVYAMSSFFTAFVFWAILKWERVADEKHNLRWLILIAFMVGLSIGVHLLNLLAIPAIAMVYYYKKYRPGRNGIILTLILSFVLLGLIMYIIIPWLVNLAGRFELFFVNSIGMPFHSGTIIYFILLIGGITWGIHHSLRKNKVLLNTVLLSLVFILIGYSSFFMLIIRSNANTPIDENNPEDAISLLSYLNREQYGDWPIFYGQYYNAPTIDSKDGNPIYIKDEEKGKYVITDARKNTIPVYDPRFTTLFPRMWSSSKSGHIEMYEKYGKIEGVPMQVNNPDGTTETRYKPTFSENLRFFFTYQLGHMYFRYFLWNFAGRQNDIESQGEIEHGNWLSGINFIDEWRLGKQDNLPSSMQSKANNEFYLLPLILGIIGLIYHSQRHKRDAFVVFLLFFMTGIAIIIYLNQTPYQPRERDYAYAGSFYAFSIWIGLGVLALFDYLSRKVSPKPAAIAITAVSLLLVPVIMAKEGWDDHDRSGKYAARDFAINYLKSCEPNAILFTHGDNDTFPLWYAQEVEGIRTDVRVVNYMLASGAWYVQQMFNKIYESDPLPLSLKKEQYEKGVNDIVYYYDRNIKRRVELKEVIEFIGNDSPQTKLSLTTGEKINFLPAKKLKLTVDSAAVVKNGAVPENRRHEIVDEIEWEISQSYLYKNDLMLLDLISTNNWERPIYFTSPSSISKVFKVDRYCHLEGFVYKFMPVPAPEYIRGVGGVSVDKSYDILMNKCQWGNLNDPGVYVDRESMRNSIMPKQDFLRTAEGLISMGKMDSAVAVVDTCLHYFPLEKFPPDIYMIPFVEAYYDAGATEKGNALNKAILDIFDEKLKYYNSLSSKFYRYYESDVQQALGVLQRLSSAAKANGQNELDREIDSLFKKHIEMYSFEQ